MKKMLAILLTAAMIMPVTAYAATGDDPEEQTEDASGSAGESLEEAIDNALAALQDLRDEWSSSVGGSEDTEEEEEETSRRSIRERASQAEEEAEEAEEEEAPNEEYAAYDVIIEGILEDIEDTVDGMIEEWNAVFEDAGDPDDLSDEEFEDAFYDWLETCSEEIEDLMDRTNAASRDFLRMVVPDTDGDDAALEDALSYYSGALVDGTLEILYDEIVGGVLNAAYDIVDEFIEGWDPEDWDFDDWDPEDWDIGDWDDDDWGSDYWDDYDWGPEDWDIEEWDALTDFLDRWSEFGESIVGDQDDNSRTDLQSIFGL